jgi:arsenite/tail-anchored protein-transporting ATPase
VTLPEDMAIKETERMIKSLDQYGMKVKQMVINHVIPEQVGCPFCQARREEQEKYMGQIRKKFSDLNITVFPLQPHEVRGIDTLKKIGSMVFAA